MKIWEIFFYAVVFGFVLVFFVVCFWFFFSILMNSRRKTGEKK